MVSGRVATSLCFKARLRAKPSFHINGMTRLDRSKPKKLELRLSPLLNQWTKASQSRLQFTVRLCKRHETQQYNSVPLVVSRMELLKEEIYFFQ